MAGGAGHGSALAEAPPDKGNAVCTLMSVGLILTNATQFRIPGVPLGPGELCLSLWVVLALGGEIVRGGPSFSPALRRLTLFWMLFALALCLGILTGFVVGDEPDTSLVLHDAMAYPLVAAFGCLATAPPGATERLQRSAAIFVGVGAACLAGLLVVGWGIVQSTAISPWFGDRFRGWSNNPNQLAFLSAVLVLVALHLADTATRPRRRIAALLAAVPALIVGRLTKTDTFTFSLLAAIPVYAVLKIRFWLATHGPQMPLRVAFAWLMIAALPFALVSAVPLAIPAASGSSQAMLSIMKGNGKEASKEANLRLALWAEATGRGLEAYLLGFGPGPHLPMPAEVQIGRRGTRTPDLDPHPSLNGTANFEAHSTLLDIFTQGGLVAVCSFLWLLIVALAASHKARLAGLVALLACVVVFGLTNNIIRQPVFWFAICMCLTATGWPKQQVQPRPLRRSAGVGLRRAEALSVMATTERATRPAPGHRRSIRV